MTGGWAVQYVVNFQPLAQTVQLLVFVKTFQITLARRQFCRRRPFVANCWRQKVLAWPAGRQLQAITAKPLVCDRSRELPASAGNILFDNHLEQTF